MKVPKRQDKDNNDPGLKRNKPRARKNDNHVDELLKICLQKICDLQKDLEKDEFEDTFEQGYSACANEAMRFLTEQGMPMNHPIIQTLTQKFLKP